MSGRRSQRVRSSPQRYSPAHDTAVAGQARRTGQRVPATDFFRNELEVAHGESETGNYAGGELHISVEISSDDESEQGDVAPNRAILGNVVVGREQTEEVRNETMEPAVVSDTFSLTDRVLPPLPQPSLNFVPSNADGWDAIDRLGADISFRCQVPLLQEVPEQHKGTWTCAYSQVLRRWRDATTVVEITRALLWLGFLPQALLRKPSHGGQSGRTGRVQVARRFNVLTEGDWGKLVEMFETDMERVAGRARGRRIEVESDELVAKTTKEVLCLIASGHLGKAMSRVTLYGVADIRDPAILQQLRDKFPNRQDDLPAMVPHTSAIDSFPDLREKLLALEPSKSPGSGGCKPEYLTALGERMEDSEIGLLEDFCLAYTSGSLPPWFYVLWLSLETVPLNKDEQRVEARPLGLRHSLTRLCHREVTDQCKDEVREFLEPVQLGQSRAGAAKLVLSVRGLMDSNPDWVCVSLDMKNCYNSVSRHSILDVIVDTPELEHLTTFAATILAPEPALESRGQVWGSTTTGMVQGDPFSGAGTAIGIQPSLLRLDSECAVGGGGAHAGADDIFAQGPGPSPSCVASCRPFRWRDPGTVWPHVAVVQVQGVLSGGRASILCHPRPHSRRGAGGGQVLEGNDGVWGACRQRRLHHTQTETDS